MDRQLIIAELDDIARQLAAHDGRYRPLNLGDLALRLLEVIAQIDQADNA
jgi:hypothetical protein